MKSYGCYLACRLSELHTTRESSEGPSGLTAILLCRTCRGVILVWVWVWVSIVCMLSLCPQTASTATNNDTVVDSTLVATSGLMFICEKHDSLLYIIHTWYSKLPQFVC